MAWDQTNRLTRMNSKMTAGIDPDLGTLSPENEVLSVEEFDYFLPQDLIAQKPIEPRDRSRLMVLFRGTGTIEHAVFKDLGRYLDPGDCIVLNDTRVLPARLYGRRKDTGGKVEILLVERLSGNAGEGGRSPVERWSVLAKPARRLRLGSSVVFGSGDLEGIVISVGDRGERVMEFIAGSGDRRTNTRAIERPYGTAKRTFSSNTSGDDFLSKGYRTPSDTSAGMSDTSTRVYEKILSLGKVPLPPYIKEDLDRPERYQTVYALHPGSVAAPTAGLHFTEELLEALKSQGIATAYLTLHVGPGTFRPIKTKDVREHAMHEEGFRISEDACETINSAKDRGNRVVAVGTTCVRVLETCATPEGRVKPMSGRTSLYIYPPYRFRAVDAMVTNFHLPRSTLLLLVSAFAGRDLCRKAYEAAIKERYRFYSFGDAMLVL